MIDIEKFIGDVYKLASVRANHELCHALRYGFSQQGLEYKDGKIVNVELGFKVGDWVTNGIETVQITGYDIDYGFQVDYKGNLQQRNRDIIEKEYRLWTIQDAKDGDVLADDMGIILFRKIGNEKYAEVVDYHCVLFTRGEFKIQKGLCYWGLSTDPQLRLATKVQRERFFAAMHDAGYEWDSEKLELRKIEEREKNDSLYDKGYQHGFSATKFNQWKPTDEQMEAFDFYLKTDIDEDGVFGRQLVKLYNDLKKLREK